MPALQDFILHVQDYVASHRREGLEAFEVSGIYDLFPQSALTGDAAAHKWPESWPNSANAGVYGVFADDLTLLYVGKSSMNSCLGARLSAYFGYTPERACRVKSEWRIQPRFLATVAVPDSATWEAPALEEFLIQRVNPPLNRNGRSANGAS
jgi:hypothetical protein